VTTEGPQLKFEYLAQLLFVSERNPTARVLLFRGQSLSQCPTSSRGGALMNSRNVMRYCLNNILLIIFVIRYVTRVL